MSPEAEDRIKSYIRGRKKANRRPVARVCRADHRTTRCTASTTFRAAPAIRWTGRGDHPGDSAASQGRAAFGMVGELAGRLISGVRRYTTDPVITREMLVLNTVSVYALIVHCRIPMMELYQAGIVTNVHDLKTLHFTAPDLVRTRELFDVNRLCMLFSVNQEGMRSAGCKFGLRELRKCQFKQGELEALDVDIGRIIAEDGGEPAHLIALGWDYKKLCGRGLTHDSLERLGIGRKEALDPVPSGLGWSRVEYEKLAQASREEKK